MNENNYCFSTFQYVSHICPLILSSSGLKERLQVVAYEQYLLGDSEPEEINYQKWILSNKLETV